MSDRQPEYLAGEVERALAADPRTHELGVRAEVDGDTIVVRGEVGGAERRRLIEDVVAEVAPGMALRNEVSVISVGPPATEESV